MGTNTSRYNSFSKQLESMSVFQSQDLCEHYITDGITGSVQNYIIHVAPDVNVTLDASNSTICSSTSCKYNYQATNEMSDFNSTVYVIEKNLLTDRQSERQVCSNKTISKCINPFKDLCV